jgi:hypothetical protein
LTASLENINQASLRNEKAVPKLGGTAFVVFGFGLT